jgi:hypothetical protein
MVRRLQGWPSARHGAPSGEAAALRRRNFPAGVSDNMASEVVVL